MPRSRADARRIAARLAEHDGPAEVVEHVRLLATWRDRAAATFD